MSKKYFTRPIFYVIIKLYKISKNKKIYQGGFMRNIINLTPHNINVVDSDGNEILVLEKSETPLRVTETQEKVGNINGLDIFMKKYGDVENLPEEKENTYYVVSAIVANACKGKRNDLLVVNDTVRNDKGQIVGCKSFAVI